MTMSTKQTGKYIPVQPLVRLFNTMHYASVHLELHNRNRDPDLFNWKLAKRLLRFRQFCCFFSTPFCFKSYEPVGDRRTHEHDSQYGLSGRPYSEFMHVVIYEKN